MRIIKITVLYIIVLPLLFLSAGCEKYLENTQLPSGTIAGTEAFVSDNSVAAIVTGVISSLNSSGPVYASPLTGLYTDELKPLPETLISTFNWSSYQNSLSSTGNVNLWSPLYSRVFAANSTIEGINSTPAKLYYKNQWLGETYFVRALAYYYLTNLYGDAVLALNSDYQENGSLKKSTKENVLAQVIADLQVAKQLLDTVFKNGNAAPTAERARPNRGAASALLAKAYLMAGEWEEAEAEASLVINNTGLYQLVNLTDVFLKNSKETIWALATPNDVKTVEYDQYNRGMPASTPNPPKNLSVLVSMSEHLLDKFEPGDNRRTTWVRSTVHTGVTPNITYFFPNKYRSNVIGAERSIVLRLADILLVRAEARAHQNNIEGAQSDLNAVRNRAGLGDTPAESQEDLLAAIANERQVELFTEYCNRFFDLKRTGRLDEVMTIVAPGKDANWESYKNVWPIPVNDITYNTNLEQNTGY